MSKKLKITQMPPLPTVMLSLIKFDSRNPDNDATALERLLLPDKGACADILRIANSAYYGRSGKIKDLKGAITLMGVKGVKNLVVLLSSKQLQGKLTGPAFQNHLMQFPILAALIALDLSKPAGHPTLRDDAFIGSLLCKMGMTVIALNESAGYQKVLGETTAGSSLRDLEQQAFELDHIEVGKDLFATWKLPPELVQVVEQHSLAPTEIQEPVVRLVALGLEYAGRMLNLPVHHNAERTAQLEAALGMNAEAVAGFGDEYFENIQTHPFYEQAVSK